MTILGADLELDPSTHDLVLVDGAAQLVASVEQKIKIRLLFIRGEWFLDIEAGIPYIDQVFVKQPNIDLLRALYRTEIIETPGVLAVREMRVTFISSTRRLSISFTADSDAGEIDQTVVTP